MKNFLRFLKSRLFLLNLAVALAIVTAILVYIFNYLNTYTLHGETITVPDLIGMKISEVQEFLKEKPFRYLIVDSVFNKKQKKGTLVEQTPKPGEKVKQNRTLYLIVNASQPRRVKMPNLVDMSLRQAISTLQASGLEIGVLEYQPNIAKNAVIAQKTGNGVALPGIFLNEGTPVDLVLGMGLSDEQVPIPLLQDLTRQESLEMLKINSLNEGAVIFDETVKNYSDSLIARVNKQSPDPAAGGGFVNMGSSIDLWFSIRAKATEPDE